MFLSASRGCVSKAEGAKRAYAGRCRHGVSMVEMIDVANSDADKRKRIKPCSTNGDALVSGATRPALSPTMRSNSALLWRLGGILAASAMRSTARSSQTERQFYIGLRCEPVAGWANFVANDPEPDLCTIA
jgi:hypothetical protein